MVDKDIYKFRYYIIPAFCSDNFPNRNNFDQSLFALNLCEKDEQTKRSDRILQILGEIKTSTRPQHIIMSWILLWCLTFKYLQSVEK